METNERLRIPYPVIVEGKYDRLRLLSVIDATVLTTDGFAIFRRGERLALFRALAEKTPIIVLTDPDGAGKLIRAHIGSAIPPDRLIPLYVPQIRGKEPRKRAPSAAGLLGVEGQERERLRQLFLPFAVAPAEDATATGGAAPKAAPKEKITKADLFADGLTGCKDATARRALLAGHLSLPLDMTPNALLAALNVLLDREEYRRAVNETLGAPNTAVTEPGAPSA